MAMDLVVKRVVQASDIALDARWSRVEAIADGALIADGVLLDVRGAKNGYTLFYQPALFADGAGKQIALSKAPDGAYTAEIEDTHNGGTAISRDTTVSSYPAVIHGATGQTVASTHADSVTELEGLKQAARDLHTQLNAWADGLDRYSRGVPHADVVKGHDFLYEAHRAAWAVMGRRTGITAWDRTSGNGERTIAQRVEWAREMAKGAADTATPLEFYAKAHSLSAPTVPASWVGRGGSRVNLASVIEFPDASPPAELDIVGASWIDDLKA